MATAPKKRKYMDSYIEYGFTVVRNSGIEKPQCVICCDMLSGESMKPSKLKRHLETRHPEYLEKEPSFFQRKEDVLKRSRLDTTGTYHQQLFACIEASYAVSLRIAKAKKPHTIGGDLILPCSKDMVRLVLGDEHTKKLSSIPLSNDTVHRRISEMSNNILMQVVKQLKSSPFKLFSLQLDDSTDVSSYSQLLVYVRYVHEKKFKEDFLLCRELETTTKAQDVFELINRFFQENNIEWKNLCGVCTDGAPAMLGSRSGFQKLVKDRSPEVTSIHCMIHRQALACKTMPSQLLTVMTLVIKIVDFIKSSALNTRLFRELCEGMTASHQTLLFHTQVRWLSKGKVLKRVLELLPEIKIFLDQHGKHEFLAQIDDPRIAVFLIYLVDIFERINTLNLSL